MLRSVCGHCGLPIHITHTGQRWESGEEELPEVCYFDIIGLAVVHVSTDLHEDTR